MASRHAGAGAPHRSGRRLQHGQQLRHSARTEQVQHCIAAHLCYVACMSHTTPRSSHQATQPVAHSTSSGSSLMA